MPKTVYAVSAGSYSDYHVVALFSTKAKAEEYMAAVPYGDYNTVEVYEIDPPIADLIRRGYAPWTVHMRRDGTVERASRGEVGPYSPVGSGAFSIWKRSIAPAYIGKGIPDCLTATVWAKSEAQAVKITNEHRLQMIADGSWALSRPEEGP